MSVATPLHSGQSLGTSASVSACVVSTWPQRGHLILNFMEGN